ncbi:hypothetical protein ALT1644_460011 [Alteromonas macleodii]
MLIIKKEGCCPSVYDRLWLWRAACGARAYSFDTFSKCRLNFSTHMKICSII